MTQKNYWERLYAKDKDRRAQEGLDFVTKQKADAYESWRNDPAQNRTFQGSSTRSPMRAGVQPGMPGSPTGINKDIRGTFNPEKADTSWSEGNMFDLESLTEDEIKAIQKRNGLKVDGQLGPNTVKAFMKEQEQAQQEQSKQRQVQSTASDMGATRDPNIIASSSDVGSLRELSELKEKTSESSKPKERTSESGKTLSELKQELAKLISDRKKIVKQMESNKPFDAQSIVDLGLGSNFASDLMGLNEPKSSSTKFTDEYKEYLRNEKNNNKKNASLAFNEAIIAYDKVKRMIVEGDESKLDEANELYAKAREAQAEALGVGVPQGYLPKLETVESAVTRVKDRNIKDKMATAQAKLAGANVANIGLKREILEQKVEEGEEKKLGTDKQRSAAAIVKELIRHAKTIDNMTTAEILQGFIPGVTSPAEIAANNFREAILRDKSGAAIGVQEDAQEADRYTPGLLDKENSLRAKSEVRADMINRMIAAAGPAWTGGTYTSQFGKEETVTKPKRKASW